ncbi:MAG: hypothetical protein AAFP97_08875, partial [Pseudomonadota bacterium]
MWTDGNPLSVLTEGDPATKALKGRNFRKAILEGAYSPSSQDQLIDAPARPDRPELVSPKHLAKRRLGSPSVKTESGLPS